MEELSLFFPERPLQHIILTITSPLCYSISAYDFPELIRDFVGRDLETLSADLPPKVDTTNFSLYKTMEHSPHHRRFYAALNGPRGKAFYELYDRFVAEVIRPQFDGPILYQRRPSHRILFRDLSGESRYHRDRDYGHVTGEVNFLVPQTPMFASNSMWIESAEGREDYQPLELQPGEYARFRGVDLSHGAHRNTTDRSRVSFDFRVIPVAEAPPEYLAGTVSGRTGNPVMANARQFIRHD